jgi:hypothetical protein
MVFFNLKGSSKAHIIAEDAIWAFFSNAVFFDEFPLIPSNFLMLADVDIELATLATAANCHVLYTPSIYSAAMTFEVTH